MVKNSGGPFTMRYWLCVKLDDVETILRPTGSLDTPGDGSALAAAARLIMAGFGQSREIAR